VGDFVNSGVNSSNDKENGTNSCRINRREIVHLGIKNMKRDINKYDSWY
jgi:hypothetical protein